MMLGKSTLETFNRARILHRKEKVTPWDHGAIQPPLKDILESGEVEFPRQGRALVPGCGRVSAQFKLAFP